MLCFFGWFHFLKESLEIFLFRVRIIKVGSKCFLYLLIIKSYSVFTAEFQARHLFLLLLIISLLIFNAPAYVRQSQITAAFQQTVCLSECISNPFRRKPGFSHPVLDQAHDYKCHKADQKVCTDMFPLVQINRKRRITDRLPIRQFFCDNNSAWSSMLRYVN